VAARNCNAVALVASAFVRPVLRVLGARLAAFVLATAGPALEAMRRMGITAYYVSGRSSDAPALLAAGAKHARSLMYVGPSERPTSLPATAVSGVYGDPTSTREAGHTDVSSRCADIMYGRMVTYECN